VTEPNTKPTRGRRAAKPPAGTPAAINLEQSEVMRQRALGAQQALRDELDLTKGALKESSQFVIEVERERTKLEEQRDVERAGRLAAVRERDELAKKLEIALSDGREHQREATHLRGQLAMLERLGTIPKQEPELDQFGYRHPTPYRGS